MDSFGSKSTLIFNKKNYTFFNIKALEKNNLSLNRLPFSLKILLENLLRHEDGLSVSKEDIIALAQWNPKETPSKEISFSPARVILQDYTGVPCIVDLASMRNAMIDLGGDPKKINPLQRVDLVIDHSVQVDAYGLEEAIKINRDFEYKRNQERYEFLKWGQKALSNFKVVPPNTGIVHQVNLEYLAPVLFYNEQQKLIYPDTLVGTDSHTTMINGLGILGWGVGGIEAEAAMLGQPISMLIPQVIGFKLTGKLPEGSTATDLVLTVTEILRQHGVVGKFVEFFGSGIANLPLADRATLGNMAPEYGATCAIFPIDQETLEYLKLTGRHEDHIQLIEKYYKECGLFYDSNTPDPEYTSIIELDLSSIQPSIAGPKRPQDRFLLSKAEQSFTEAFQEASTAAVSVSKTSSTGTAILEKELAKTDLTHGSVVIAAITSCTNTSNPSVMVAAGLVARKATEKGLLPKPWVKTSLAPGSKVVTNYLERSGLLEDLNKIGFNIVGYGCTTCIGNSGPLDEEISKKIRDENIVAVSVLSGNRNFEGRINQDVRANYLMSPPLVVAYALAGTIHIDLTKDVIAFDKNNKPVYLKDLWPTQKEISEVITSSLNKDMFISTYHDVFEGDEKWESISIPQSELYDWKKDSTYVRKAPFFDNMAKEAPEFVADILESRVLAKLGDSITTDHISPAGNIKIDSPAGKYLTERGVKPHMFNSYGARRGNHEVMVRGTFANIRLRNQLAPGTEGGFTKHFPSNNVMSIFEASTQYQNDGTPLIILAGKEYGSGSSRDWAAKGPLLLGVKAIIAESYERIHRSNLIGMGILPLEFKHNENADSLGLKGDEYYDVLGLQNVFKSSNLSQEEVTVRVKDSNNNIICNFKALVRIDTPKEADYYRHGGILQYVLRNLV